MLLRSFQQELVDDALAALAAYGNTLAVAPTGSGKTIMLSAVAGSMLGSPDTRACIVVHRDELVRQNRAKFEIVNPGIATSVYTGVEKSFDGRAIFATVQTVSLDRHLECLPRFDLLIIDEAHHAASDSYRRLYGACKDRNPDLRLFGVTATATRGDGKGFDGLFDNVSHVITLGELIRSGHLVPPRTFVIDLGNRSELEGIPHAGADFDMRAVEQLMNRAPLTTEVIRHWHEKAGARKTIVYCATVAHARDVSNAFNEAGLSAVMVDGSQSPAERSRAIKSYESGRAQIIVNVAVLTEGYDFPPTSCVVILRPTACHAQLIQMIGRGLRLVDAELHSGFIKEDCLVLDFGTASLLHGSLEQSIDLAGSECRPRQGHSKSCPRCETRVPAHLDRCAVCDFTWTGQRSPRPMQPSVIEGFALTEVDLLAQSNFPWIELSRHGDLMAAGGIDAWTFVICGAGIWYAIGGRKGLRLKVLHAGARIQALACANDWLNRHETVASRRQAKEWIGEPPTDRQLGLLPAACRWDFGLSRYRASMRLAFQFNEKQLKQLVPTYAGFMPVAA